MACSLIKDCDAANMAMMLKSGPQATPQLSLKSGGRRSRRRRIGGYKLFLKFPYPSMSLQELLL